MSRSIKFRVWSPKTKKFFMQEDYQRKDLSLNYYEITAKVAYPQQYSGIIDSAGGEIYEGDIITVEYGKGEVVFQFGCFMIQWIDDPEAMMELLSMRDCKHGRPRNDLLVIGDIYRNPELLKK